MDKVKVYWAPFIDYAERNHNLVYNEPKSLYDILYKNRNKNIDPGGSMFSCPVISTAYHNIFSFNNPIDSHYKFKLNQDTGESMYMPIIEKSMNVNTYVLSSIKNNSMFEYEPRWIFFAEEPLDMITTSPYYHKPKHTNYGSMTPGKLDISKWFRVINIQINLWDNVDEFKIEKDEPLFYANFITDKKVELVRFELNDYLIKHARTIASSAEWEPRISLSERFDRFKLSRTRDLILREIKKQVLPD